MTEFRPDEENVAYIGEGVKLTGAIHAHGAVVIDGVVDGEITCNYLFVGASGVVNGKVVVSDAEIWGNVDAEIVVKQLLVVRASGRVNGKWTYGEIAAEKGAIIEGAANALELSLRRESAEPNEKQRPIYGKPQPIRSPAEKGKTAPDVVVFPRVASPRSLDHKRKVGPLASRASRQ